MAPDNAVERWQIAEPAPDSLEIVRDAVRVCAARVGRGGSAFVRRALLTQWALYVRAEPSNLERLRFLRTLPESARYEILRSQADELNAEVERIISLPWSVVPSYEPEQQPGVHTWVARTPELSGCMGSGFTEEEAIADLAEARAGLLTVMFWNGDAIPEPCGRSEAL